MTATNLLARPRPEGVRFVRRRGKFSWWRAFTLLVLVAGALLMMSPFVWLVSSSLKTQLQIFQFPPSLLPNPPVLRNYVEALVIKPFHLYLRNTLVIVLLNEIAVLWAASFCAYGFTRIWFPGRDAWFLVVLATMMLPGVVMIVPSFVIFARLKWIDSFLPLTAPAFFGGGAFNIFLLSQFFRTIPEELADAARIDGCGEFSIYARIIAPLAKPALTTVGVFVFLGTWNDFMGPLLYLNTPDKFTVSLGLALFRGSLLQTRWDLLMAASVMTTLPVIIIFFLAQRYFVQGVVMTGLKG